MLDIELDEILTSPYVRARQTAELLAEGFVKPPKITNVHALAERVSRSKSSTRWRATRSASTSPWSGTRRPSGEVAARLLGHRKALDFKKGGVACIEVEALPLPRPGVLVWFMPPRALLAGVTPPEKARDGFTRASPDPDMLADGRTRPSPQHLAWLE